MHPCLKALLFILAVTTALGIMLGISRETVSESAEYSISQASQSVCNCRLLVFGDHSADTFMPRKTSKAPPSLRYRRNDDLQLQRRSRHIGNNENTAEQTVETELVHRSVKTKSDGVDGTSSKLTGDQKISVIFGVLSVITAVVGIILASIFGCKQLRIAWVSLRSANDGKPQAETPHPVTNHEILDVEDGREHWIYGKFGHSLGEHKTLRASRNIDIDFEDLHSLEFQRVSIVERRWRFLRSRRR